ncbi:MAG: ankyrin repeat domain-containing protein [Sediminispirochaetaceae bacterium]
MTYVRSGLVVLGLIIFLSCSIAAPLHAGKKPLVRTSWNRSGGIQFGDDIYFLSSYSLYMPGKVIIPMFVVTRPKVYYRNFSLYRLSTTESGGIAEQQKIERVWSCDACMTGRKVDLQSCRYGQDEGRIYFQWTGGWDNEQKQSIRPALEYDPEKGTARMIEVITGPEIPAGVELAYDIPGKIKESWVWLQAGRLPLDAWELPSPLEYSSDDPDFLQKVIIRNLGDRDFKSAALTALDELREPAVMERILSEMEQERGRRSDYSYNEYYERMTALIEMSAPMRSGRSPDIFSAAFDNDADLLRRLLEAGTDPDSADRRGRTPLMYAVFGKAPDTLRLLFEAGADPQRETESGQTAWLYAALNPLRPLYLELWGK